MSKLIYIGSPYSHPDPDKVKKNFDLVSNLAAKMCSEGHVAFSPITYGHTLLGFQKMPSDWEFWKNFCLSFLKKSDQLLVYKIEGWENSKGLKEEIEYADANGIHVIYIDPPKQVLDNEYEKEVESKL